MHSKNFFKNSKKIFMKKILVFLIIPFVFIPAAHSVNYCQDQVNNHCLNENEFPCIKYLVGCCYSNLLLLGGADCEGTEIHFEEIFEDFCLYENYLGINGNSTFLNITTKARYDGVEYDIIEISCNLNKESFCALRSETGVVNCTISSPQFKISKSNFLECNISHPTLFLIANSTFLNFKTFDFYVRFELEEVQTGTSIIPIYFKSNSIIPTDFVLKLSTENKNVRIYEEIKKTITLSCKQEEKVSYLVETVSPGMVNFNLMIKPNFNIPCSQDLDCSIFENGKCIDAECWASYDFLVQVKSKIPEFDYTYVYTFFLSILALIFILLLIEAIVRK